MAYQFGAVDDQGLLHVFKVVGIGLARVVIVLIPEVAIVVASATIVAVVAPVLEDFVGKVELDLTVRAIVDVAVEVGAVQPVVDDVDGAPLVIVIDECDLAVNDKPLEGSVGIVIAPAVDAVVHLVAASAGSVGVDGFEAHDSVVLTARDAPTILIVGSYISLPVAVHQRLGQIVVIALTAGERHHGHQGHHCVGKNLFHISFSFNWFHDAKIRNNP